MSHHTRIEEVSDSDPDDMDPSDFDPADFSQDSIIQSINPPQRTEPARPVPTPQAAQPPPSTAQKEVPKNWQCLYPVYFDKTRTRSEGRRVGKQLAVENPLAYDMVIALSRLGLGLQVGFEPDKLHPKDWGNPGRVRVLLKENGKPVSPRVHNKQHLYDLVGQYLKDHPTTERSPLNLQLRGFPTPPGTLKRPDAPRGWKIGTVLPLHSPANSWGGVSNNPLKDAMMEMQGQPGFPGIPGISETPSGGEGKKKKDKKKGKA